VYAGDRGTVNISDDRVETWTPSTPDLPASFNNTLLADPEDPAHIYAGMNMNGVYITTDQGASWFMANEGLVSRHILELDADPLDPETIFASTGDGVYRSTDEGIHWTKSGDGQREGIARGLTFDPQDPTHILTAIEGQGVFESVDRGATWTEVGAPGPENLDFWSVAMDRSNPPRIHVGTTWGVFSLTLLPTGVGDDAPSGPGFPRAFSLAQNYPNPFNPSTTIRYEIPAPADGGDGRVGGQDAGAIAVRLTIHDVRGRRVRTLVDEERPPGRHAVHWDGSDERGRAVSSGFYLYRIEAGGFVKTRKMVLAR
jgi:hypothetical protein